MSYADPDPAPDWNNPTNRSGALAAAIALLLVALGGNCRGATAETPPKRRSVPMTAAQWATAYDECVAHLGTPIILAGRHPGLSAGVGCIPVEVLGQ